jgi:hypothetical protein
VTIQDKELERIYKIEPVFDKTATWKEKYESWPDHKSWNKDMRKLKYIRYEEVNPFCKWAENTNSEKDWSSKWKTVLKDNPVYPLYANSCNCRFGKYKSKKLKASKSRTFRDLLMNRIDYYSDGSNICVNCCKPSTKKVKKSSVYWNKASLSHLLLKNVKEVKKYW